MSCDKVGNPQAQVEAEVARVAETVEEAVDGAACECYHNNHSIRLVGLYFEVD